MKIFKLMKNAISKVSLSAAAVAAFVIFYGASAMADGASVTVTAPAIGDALSNLFAAIKDHGSVAVLIMAVVQVLKTNEVIGILGKVSSKFLPVIIAVLTTVGYIVGAVIAGKSWFQGAIEGLVTSGGAMLIYEAIRQIKVSSAGQADVAAKVVK